MLKILAYVALVLVVVLVGLLVFAATKPGMLRVQRVTSIQAPPEEIFPLINDFQHWGAWSPYEKVDPTMKRTYSGAERGEGAVYAWEGNGNVGHGSMTIVETSPPDYVIIDLAFTKPFEGHNEVKFTLEPQGETTHVTWDMRGPNTYMSKVMQIFLNMDTMIGKQFEQGLADLKRVAESADNPAAAPATPSSSDVPETSPADKPR